MVLDVRVLSVPPLNSTLVLNPICLYKFSPSGVASSLIVLTDV